MAPTRLASKPIIGANENANGILSHGVSTRSKQIGTLKPFKESLKVPHKRKADSPLKDGTAKRAAFGDITNAINKSSLQDKALAVKKVTVESKLLPTVKSIKQTATNNILVNSRSSKTKQLQKVAANAFESVQKHFGKDLAKSVTNKVQNGILKNTEKRDKVLIRESQSNSAKSVKSDESGDPSLYVSALEHISPIGQEEYKCISEKLDQVVLEDSINRSLDDETHAPHKVPVGVVDFDLENWNDPYQVSNYAMDIFNYLKNKEPAFFIGDYLQHQKEITSWMRALLVDWMVEVQESFELNHETLYLAVKLVDLFLSKSKKNTSKEELQLLGASALFIAAKFDERIPPLVDDFLYICDGAYTLSQLLAMEMSILKVVDYNLGIPLSYRFLRRYARCARVSMPTLTLARFVLELCLLDYTLVQISDSKMAAAALFLALKMKALGDWTPTLRYYTGYSVQDILPIAKAQNASLHKKPKEAISTVRNKYSHRIFFEVAKVPLIDDLALCS